MIMYTSAGAELGGLNIFENLTKSVEGIVKGIGGIIKKAEPVVSSGFNIYDRVKQTEELIAARRKAEETARKIMEAKAAAEIQARQMEMMSRLQKRMGAGMDWTTIALIGGGGLLALTLLMRK